MTEFAVSVVAIAISAVALLASVASVLYAHRQWKAASDAVTEARRSAEAAELSARVAAIADENARHGWAIESAASGNDSLFALRNTGTFDAENVGLRGDFDPVGFDLARPDVTVRIGSGQAITFWALRDTEHAGREVLITWQNQVPGGAPGELSEQYGWTEPLPL